jgi:hypothetical protein
MECYSAIKKHAVDIHSNMDKSSIITSSERDQNKKEYMPCDSVCVK